MKIPVLMIWALLFFIGRIHPLCGEESAPMMTEVSFVSKGDGSEQKYVLLLPAAFKADAEHNILIAFHGHGSDRWQFVKQKREECRAARDVAAKHKMIFVSPDYRAKTSWMGPKAEADVVQIIGELKRKYRVAKVLLCGHSNVKLIHRPSLGHFTKYEDAKTILEFMIQRANTSFKKAKTPDKR